jgi:hypothetical protein
MKILRSADRFMSRARDSRLAWTAIASAVGLNSTAGLNEAEIGQQLGVTELSVRRARARFTRLANLDPGGGLRFTPPASIQRRAALKENGERGL